MGAETKIEWCDSTWNPWIGCTKVSPGCAHCYAENATPTRTARAKGRELWGRGQPRQRTSEANWKLPLRWNRKWRRENNCIICHNQRHGGPPENKPCEYCVPSLTPRPRVFCASLADWLDDEVPIEWLADLLKLIHDTPNLDWLLLTKRPQNWKDRCFEALHRWEEIRFNNSPTMDRDFTFSAWISNWIGGHEAPSNCWIGTTVEDQQQADERIPELLKIPARVRFLSCEPLLGPVDIAFLLMAKFGRLDESFKEVEAPAQKIHWVIAGSESGSKRRTMETPWVVSLKDQCAAAGVSFFMKQMEIEGKVSTDVSRFPIELQRREFPV